MITWITQADVNQTNDGLKTLKIKRVTSEKNEETEKKIKLTEREKDKPDLTDPNGLILNPKYLCYNCSNYGHSSRECLAPYCNLCEVIRPDHRSNACPNPKEKKRSRRSIRVKPEQKKGKSSIKTPLKIRGKKGVKAISSSSYLTDEDADEDSLRNDAESERYEDSPEESEDEDRTNFTIKS